MSRWRAFDNECKHIDRRFHLYIRSYSSSDDVLMVEYASANVEAARQVVAEIALQHHQ